MKTLPLFALTLALTAPAAFANDPLTQIAGQARELAADYRKMSDTLKNKNFAPAELKQELQESEAALTQIRTLLAEFSSTHPQFTTAQRKDWKLTQDLVALLGIFHDRKNELLEESNAQKKRGEIRAHTQGLVTRATMLEAAVLRLTGANAGS
jgi:hypothetical protein